MQQDDIVRQSTRAVAANIIESFLDWCYLEKQATLRQLRSKRERQQLIQEYLLAMEARAEQREP